MYLFLYFLSIYTLLATNILALTLEPAQCPPWITQSSCNRIFVPLDHANPITSVRIPILSALITTPNLKDAQFVAVDIPGGPGGAALTRGNETIYLEIVKRIQRPILLVDPRGTGNDSRLSCPTTDGLQVQSLNLTLAQRASFTRDCLLEAGPQIIHYSTNAIVEDLEIVRKVYGFKQYDLYGASYGTYIQQSYALKYPDSIRSMTLDSPVPLDYNIYSPTRAAAYKRIYETQNANDPGFNFTEVLENTGTVLQLLRNEETRREINILPFDLFNFFAFTSGNRYPQAIKQAAVDGNFTLIKDVLRVPDERTPLNVFNFVAADAISCNDIVNRVPWSPDANLQERIISWSENLLLNGNSTAYAPFTILEALPRASGCVSFPFTQLRREGTPTKLPPQKDIPVLVLFGDLDEVTPIEDAGLLDPVLRSKIAIIRGGEHVVFEARDSCADKLVFEFAATGENKNLTSCA